MLFFFGNAVWLLPGTDARANGQTRSDITRMETILHAARFFLRRHRNFLQWPSPFDGPAVCGLTVTGGGEAVLCSVSVVPLVVRNPVWIGHY